MSLLEKSRRRLLGIVFLVAALVMLIVGIAFLDRRLAALPMLIYWLVCLALTVGAMVTALRDLRAIREETADKHRDLLHEVAQEITKDAEKKNRGER